MRSAAACVQQVQASAGTNAGIYIDMPEGKRLAQRFRADFTQGTTGHKKLEATVGAFDVVVLESPDAGVVMTWLGDNGYVQDPNAEPILQGYIDQDPRMRDVFNSMSPLGRMASTDEQAAVALFLASDESSYCTGAAFVADGGITSMHPVVG